VRVAGREAHAVFAAELLPRPRKDWLSFPNGAVLKGSGRALSERNLPRRLNRHCGASVVAAAIAVSIEGGFRDTERYSTWAAVGSLAAG
jgi:hypothetical protein